MNQEELVNLRRDLHRHPEPAWCEFYTTDRIIRECERIGVDSLYSGKNVIDESKRYAVPDEDELKKWSNEAKEAGARADVLDEIDNGYTGVVAVLEQGDGPVIALRVDIDALIREESLSEEHIPTNRGFRSETEAMHACGHDAHATIGIGVLEAISDSEFEGTFKLLFQPSEERTAGGEPVAESGHLDDVEYLLATHVGLNHPTGEVIAGIDDFLAVHEFYAKFSGEPSHAGGSPHQGNNAVQAMATAIENLYAIPRNDEGATRINTGVVGGGTATNIIPESSFIQGEVRGRSTELMEYMFKKARTTLKSASEMHDCSVDLSTISRAPSAKSDQELVNIVYNIANNSDSVNTSTERDTSGGSEDATYLMRKVQENGGLATYICIGTDHPGSHHTSTFDVDEESLVIGVEVISDSILKIAQKGP